MELTSQRAFQRAFTLYSGIAGSFFLMGFSINALLDQRYLHAVPLVLFFFLAVASLIMMVKKDKTSIGQNSVALLSFLMMSYLLFTGGCCSGTGPLWAYPLTLFIVLLKGFRIGLLFILAYTSLIAFVFFTDPVFAYSYSTAFEIRFFASFLVLALTALIFEYHREISNHETLSIHEQLLDASRSDPLTKLLNRRASTEVLLRLFKHYQSTGTEFSIIMFDIDHFKRVNDSYGHKAGDDILVQLGTLLTTHIRSDDLAVRWGGEEFVIILPSTNAEKAVATANKIKRELSELDFSHLGLSHPVTASFGVQSVTDLSEVDELLVKADAKLYEAKLAGRNQVIS